MSPLDADAWIAAMLEDEGWQAPLDDDLREQVIARIETLLPAGSALDEGHAARLRASLLAMSELAARLDAGTLDAPALVGAWLRHGVA